VLGLASHGLTAVTGLGRLEWIWDDMMLVQAVASQAPLEIVVRPLRQVATSVNLSSAVLPGGRRKCDAAIEASMTGLEIKYLVQAAARLRAQRLLVRCWDAARGRWQQVGDHVPLSACTSAQEEVCINAAYCRGLYPQYREPPSPTKPEDSSG